MLACQVRPGFHPQDHAKQTTNKQTNNPVLVGLIFLPGHFCFMFSGGHEESVFYFVLFVAIIFSMNLRNFCVRSVMTDSPGPFIPGAYGPIRGLSHSPSCRSLPADRRTEPCARSVAAEVTLNQDSRQPGVRAGVSVLDPRDPRSAPRPPCLALTLRPFTSLCLSPLIAFCLPRPVLFAKLVT